MMGYQLMLFLLLSLVTRAQGYTTFTNPPTETDEYNIQSDQNPTYGVGKVIDVVWDSNYSNFRLSLYPWVLNADPIWEKNFTDTSYEWTVSLDNVTTAPSDGNYMVYFYIESFEEKSSNDSIETNNSRNFNITLPVTDSGLSTGAVAGIAVGATIGGLFLIGGLAFLLWRIFFRDFFAWKKARNEPDPETTQLPPAYNSPAVANAQQVQAELASPKERKSELPSESAVTSPQSPSPNPQTNEVYEAP